MLPASDKRKAFQGRPTILFVQISFGMLAALVVLRILPVRQVSPLTRTTLHLTPQAPRSTIDLLPIECTGMKVKFD